MRVEATNRKNPDHPDRRPFLPAWVMDKTGTPPKPKQPPQDHGKIENAATEEVLYYENFDDLPEVMTCQVCGGWEHWQSVAGIWHCMTCDPPKPKAVRFARRAAEIRRRHF